MINFYKYACSIGMGNFVEKILILVWKDIRCITTTIDIYYNDINDISKYININRK